MIFMCHRTELVDQTYRTFLKNDIEPDFIAAGRKFNPNSDCRIAMVNTLLRRLQKVSCPNVLIADECHHLASKTWKTVADYYNKGITIGSGSISLNSVSQLLLRRPVIQTNMDLF